MSQITWSGVAFALAIACGCVTAPGPDPFLGGPSDALAGARVVAVQPVLVDAVSAKSVWSKIQLEAATETELKALGFTVIPASRVEKVYEELRARLGGLYDPLTGRPDGKKTAELKRQQIELLVANYQMDLLAQPELIVTNIPFYSGVANWHGVRERVVTGSGRPDALFSVDRGTTEALSFEVRIENKSGELLYRHAGGLQLLFKAEGQRLVEVPHDRVLVNSDAITHAASLALQPLRNRLIPEAR